MLYAIGTICISYLGNGGPQNSEIMFLRAIFCFINEISLLSHFLFVIDPRNEFLGSSLPENGSKNVFLAHLTHFSAIQNDVMGFMTKSQNTTR